MTPEQIAFSAKWPKSVVPVIKELFSLVATKTGQSEGSWPAWTEIWQGDYNAEAPIPQREMVLRFGEPKCAFIITETAYNTVRNFLNHGVHPSAAKDRRKNPRHE